QLGRRRAGGDRRGHARRAQEPEPLPVADVEALELVAVLGVVEAAVGQDAVDVHDQGADRAPARTAGRAQAAAHGSVDTRPPATANGSAIIARATISTSVSPKLYSNRPATRNVTMAASEPSTSARSSAASAGSRTSTTRARRQNATKIHSQAASPITPSPAAI